MTPGRTTTPGQAAARYDAWFDTAWGAHAWAVESAAVLNALEPRAGRRIADVGCGTGRLLARLAAEGATAVGVDRNPGMLERAAARTPGRVAQADASRLPLADHSVHAAVAVTVLEFTAEPARVLAEMARVTRPGGRLVVGVLNPRSAWGWTDRGRRHRAAWSGACFLPRACLLRLGGRHGRARVTGALYGWRGMPLPRVLGPALEVLRRLAPGAGAFQLLTVELPAVPRER
jgi:SAM-dependent methyltransferase